MTTRWALGPDGVLWCGGHPVTMHWVVSVLNQYEYDLASCRAVEDAAWALIDESANDIKTSETVVHSAELQRQLEAALMAAGQLPE